MLNEVLQLGFDHLMPEGRQVPFKFFPRLGSNLSITIGSPIPPDDFKDVLRSRLDNGSTGIGLESVDGDDLGPMSEARIRGLLRGEGVEHKVGVIRSNVTAVAHRAVEDLGRKVSGKFLRQEIRQ
jgi:monolysocardiolipin acyltransferase